MRFIRLTCSKSFVQLTRRIDIRISSNAVGKSGRVYVPGKVLQRKRGEKGSILKAESQNESFVLKPVHKPFYDLSTTLATDFAGSNRLRLHINCSETEDILIYPYFKDTLLGIIQNDPDFPTTERKKILQHVREAIQELHSKDWIHTDVKPDSILVNWTSDSSRKKTVSDVALSDFDIASKSEAGKPRETRYAIGNAMWRSPDGQTGRGVTKASDIFSFGLVCIYTLGIGKFLLLNDYKELAQQGISAEQEILTRHFTYFGPVPEELYNQVNDENWHEAMMGASMIAELAAEEQPELRFIWWSRELGSVAQDMISGMTKLDPSSRTTIDQTLSHRWWQDLE